MTELGLIVVINCAALVFAALLARWTSNRDAGSAEVRRVGAAIRRALEAFVWRQLGLVALAAGALIVAASLLHGTIVPARPTLGGLEAAFWSCIGLALGSVSVSLTAYLSARIASSASLRTSMATRLSLDRALSVAIRAGGASGLLTEAVSTLGLCAWLGLLIAIKGGLSASPEQAVALARSLIAVLPSYGFGAVAAALVLQRSGACYLCAGELGATLGGEHRAGLGEHDARNPAIVASLVGDHLGKITVRSVDLFVSSTLASSVAVIIGVTALRSSAANVGAAYSLACVPFVVRSFGVIASGFGLMVVRSDEGCSPANALWRGQVTTSVVTLGGIVGASVWLLGDYPRWWLIAAGTLGMLAAASAGHLARLRADRRGAIVRELVDALRSQDLGAITLAMSAGLRSVPAPLLVIAAAMVATWHLGQASSVPGGALIASLTAVMAMLGCGPYLLAVSLFGPLAANAQGVATMGSKESHAEGERRSAKLVEAGWSATTVADTYLLVVGCLTALLAAATLPLLTLDPLEAMDLPAVNVAEPLVGWSGALGAAAVAAYAGGVIQACVRGVRGVTAEVVRQLGGFVTGSGAAQVPQDYTPSYRICIETAARGALHRVLPEVGLGLLGPIGLALLLGLAYRPVDPRLVHQALASFVFVATVTGLIGALALDGVRGALSAARRADRARGSLTISNASAATDAVAGVLGNSAGPAAHLLVKAAAVTSLAVAPFLT